ncbi:copper-binding transcription factor [Coemansia sp. RSA 552]|nr:copper-binding transcription factor [Coemansia sp. RSA 552]
MILLQGLKYACRQCIRGHRVSTCGHRDRDLIMVRRKGRPATQCSKCRELRRTRKAHVKCICNEAKLPADATALEPKSLRPAEPESPPRAEGRVEAEEASSAAKVSSIESLLNPCGCGNGSFCRCCKPAFAEYLSSKYPSQAVERAAGEVSSTLQQQRRSARPNVFLPSIKPATADAVARSAGAVPVSAPASTVKCPSGPDAPCCKVETDDDKQKESRRLATIPEQRVLPPRPATSGMVGSGMAHYPTKDLQVKLEAPSLLYPGEVARGVKRKEPPTDSERPDCKCGCDCSRRLDLLIEAIERRIGLDQLFPEQQGHDSNEPLSPPRRRPETARILPPLAASPVTARQQPRPPQTAFPSFPAIGTASAPQTGRRLSFGLPSTYQPQALPVSRQRSSSNSSFVSNSSALARISNGSPEHEQVGSKAVSRSSTRSSGVGSAGERFAAGVLPPLTTTVQMPPSLPTMMCQQQAGIAPQQALPGPKACCGGGSSGGEPSARRGRCSGSCSGDASSCACCKRTASWKPGTADSARRDGDGALMCSCGCGRPFNECTNCVTDNCVGLLLGSGN